MIRRAPSGARAAASSLTPESSPVARSRLAPSELAKRSWKPTWTPDEIPVLSLSKNQSAEILGRLKKAALEKAEEGSALLRARAEERTKRELERKEFLRRQAEELLAEEGEKS